MTDDTDPIPWSDIDRAMELAREVRRMRPTAQDRKRPRAKPTSDAESATRDRTAK